MSAPNAAADPIQLNQIAEENIGNGAGTQTTTCALPDCLADHAVAPDETAPNPGAPGLEPPIAQAPGAMVSSDCCACTAWPLTVS